MPTVLGVEGQPSHCGKTGGRAKDIVWTVALVTDVSVRRSVVVFLYVRGFFFPPSVAPLPYLHFNGHTRSQLFGSTPLGTIMQTVATVKK